MLFHGIVKNFGKETGFTVGTVLISPIFLSILGYGSAQQKRTVKIIF